MHYILHMYELLPNIKINNKEIRMKCIVQTYFVVISSVTI